MEQYIPIQTEGMRKAALSVVEKSPLPFEVEVKPYRSKRSASQNRLLWRWYTEIAQQMEVDGERFSKEDWHDLCRMKFLGVKIINIGGKEYPRPAKSTTKLKVSEMAEYLTQIEAHFLEKGVALTFTEDYGPAMGEHP